MKNPPSFLPAHHVRQLVIAAKTEALEAACEVLFIHTNDLTWGQARLGLFLVEASVGDDVDEALEVDRARSDVGFLRVVRSMRPLVDTWLIPVLAEAERSSGTDEERAVVGALASSRISRERRDDFNKLLPEMLAEIPAFAGGVASFLASAALDVRERHLNASGLTEAQYDAMAYALRRLQSVTPLARVAVADGGMSCELALAGAEGFSATSVDDDSHHVEVLKLSGALAEAKQGNDDALQLFVAEYLNHQFFEDCAFACAKFGNADDMELDVVVPRLEVGIEVKLVQAPATATDNKLDGLCAELIRQLPGYQGRGCQRVYVVTNLSATLARDLAARLHGRGPDGLSVEVVGERLVGLVRVLEDLRAELQESWDKQIESKVRAHGGVARLGGNVPDSEVAPDPAKGE